MNYLILLTSYEGLFVLVFELIFYKIFSFVLTRLITKFRMKKFVYNIELTIDKKSLKLKGFYDSGNSFCIYKYPVIFLKTKKSLKLGGISSFDNFYKKEFERKQTKMQAPFPEDVCNFFHILHRSGKQALFSRFRNSAHATIA